MRDREKSAQAASTLESTPLFRREAIEYLSARWYGTVLLDDPLSHKVLTAWFSFLALLIVYFFCKFETTRKAECQGMILPDAGVLRVGALQPGIITQTKVKEGQQVKAGEVLFVLSGERSSENTNLTQLGITQLLVSRRNSFSAELAQSKIQAKQKLEGAKRRLLELNDERIRLEEQCRLQQSRIALAELSLKRYSELQVTNYISAAQLQDKQADLLDQQQRLVDLFRMLSVARRGITEAEDNLRDLQFQALHDAESLKREGDAVKQEIAENEARREILIRAPTGGIVGVIAVVAGQTVNAGATLASILPSGSLLEADVYAPSRAIGFIRPGMQVLLRYQAFPYQKFGQHVAIVSEVASAALPAQELSSPSPSSQSNEPLYRIRLKLRSQTMPAYGKQIPLKAGMLVDASVMLEHRKLYEWVLEPLFSISGRIL